jgi:hypothetical protein
MLAPVPASFWKASLLGQKIVTSERDSRGSTRFAEVAAPARAVKLPAIRVAEMLRGMSRSLSMMWMMPLSNSMSWVLRVSRKVVSHLGMMGLGNTYGFDHLACSLDTCRHNGILLLIQTN